MEDLRVCPEQLTLLLGRDICPLEEELRDSQLAASASVCGGFIRSAVQQKAQAELLLTIIFLTD